MKLIAAVLPLVFLMSFVGAVEAQPDDSRKINLVCAKTLRQTIDVPEAKVNTRITENGADGDFLEFADGTQFIIDRKSEPRMYALKHPNGLVEQCILAQK